MCQHKARWGIFVIKRRANIRRDGPYLIPKLILFLSLISKIISKTLLFQNEMLEKYNSIIFDPRESEKFDFLFSI